MHTFVQNHKNHSAEISHKVIGPSMATSVTDHKVNPILGLQTIVGNKAVQWLIARMKLKADNPQDKHEPKNGVVIERQNMNYDVEDHVKSKHDRKMTIQRKLSVAETKSSNERLKNHGDEITGSTLSLIDDGLTSPGQPLDDTIRTKMESRFGHDFSDVRIHADKNASASARLLNAEAYTSGADIVFNKNSYTPNTPYGQMIIAHELVHVLQQRFAYDNNMHTTGRVTVSDPQDILEKEADQIAEGIVKIPNGHNQKGIPIPDTENNPEIIQYKLWQRKPFPSYIPSIYRRIIIGSGEDQHEFLYDEGNWINFTGDLASGYISMEGLHRGDTLRLNIWGARRRELANRISAGMSNSDQRFGFNSMGDLIDELDSRTDIINRFIQLIRDGTLMAENGVNQDSADIICAQHQLAERIVRDNPFHASQMLPSNRNSLLQEISQNIRDDFNQREQPLPSDIYLLTVPLGELFEIYVTEEPEHALWPGTNVSFESQYVGRANEARMRGIIRFRLRGFQVGHQPSPPELRHQLIDTVDRISGNIGRKDMLRELINEAFDRRTLPHLEHTSPVVADVGSESVGRTWAQRRNRPGRIHAAMDISGPEGTGIYAPLEGRVIQSERTHGGYGNLIRILHENPPRTDSAGTGPVTTNYAHLAQRLVSTGERVYEGMAIGLIGATGSGEGDVRSGMGIHLHFSVQRVPDTGPGRFNSEYEERRDIQVHPREWLEDLGVAIAGPPIARPRTTSIHRVLQRRSRASINAIWPHPDRKLSQIQVKNISGLRGIVNRRILIGSGEDQREFMHDWVSFTDDLASRHIVRDDLDRGDTLRLYSWGTRRRELANRISAGMSNSDQQFCFNSMGDLIDELDTRTSLVEDFIKSVRDETLSARNRDNRQMVVGQPQLTESIVREIPFEASQRLYSNDCELLVRDISNRIRREFILNPDRSALELLLPPESERFLGIPWGHEDYPGGTPGTHEREARQMNEALARILPERRPNQLTYAVITVTEEQRHRSYIESQLRPIPAEDGGRHGQRLNQHALESLHLMHIAAAADRVDLNVEAAYRTVAQSMAAFAADPNPQARAAGLSSHNLGLAIDFQMSTGEQQYEETTTRPMSNVVDMRRSAVYKWLFINASRFGWYPWHNEPWHWEYNPPGFRERFRGGMNPTPRSNVE